MTTNFYWFLPTGGDGRRLDGAVHGTGIGATGTVAASAPAGRETTLDYLTQVARAADTLGFEGC